MNLKQNGSFFVSFLAVFTLLTVTGCSTALPYQETRSGNYLYLNPFSYKPATAAEHFSYAQSLRERGHFKDAAKEFQILVKRWPDSAEAAPAKQAAAEIYFEQGKNKKAFTAYKELVQQYYTGIKDYDSILDRQYTLATKEMNRKRMRWLFGGYRAPERAVPLFESIIQNAPQWERAPEMQYMIGQAYQKNNDQELAVVAYSTVEYRYPDSPFAEKAGIAKIESFKNLVESTPYSEDIREQAELSADMFPELYTNSQYRAEAQTFRTELRDLSAKSAYEIGRFYERIPRPAQNGSAAIYYNKVVDQYDGTSFAVKSAERLHVLFPRGEALLADGTIAPILPVDAVEGESGGSESPAASNVKITAGTGTGNAHAVVSPLPERVSQDAEAIEVTADRMEYSGDLLIGDGHVAFQQKGASLQADHVSVNPKTGEIIATGNILMIREGSRWEGQELAYNYKTREGTFGESLMYFEPAYISAESSERISTNEFLMRNVILTTCSGEKPAVYAKAKEARIFDSGRPDEPFIKAKHVTFYIGPVPIFYTPVWQRHLGYNMFTWYFGAGGRLGAFAKLRAELHPTTWLTANSHFDLYSDRGLGLGQDFDWTTLNGHGGIKTYYINDSQPFDKNDPAAEQAITTSTRYRVALNHQAQLDAQTYFMTRLNWVSDPGIVEDFFEQEFANQANPENYAVVQRATENYGASLRMDHRLNDFYTTVERLPAANYDKYLAQIEDSPFYFSSENQVAFLELLNAQFPILTNNLADPASILTNVPPSDYSAGRVDTYNRIFLPLKYQDYLNVIPRAGYRGTWYSDTVAGGAALRHIVELGTLTSFKAHKMRTEKSGFYGDGLRHVVEPYADYGYRFDPNFHPDELFQFDDIDALDKQNEVRLGVRNFLQTKRGEKRIANFLDADVYTTYRFEPGTNTVLGPLVADAEMSLTDNLYVQSDLHFNWYTGEITPFNARFRYVTEDQSDYSVGYRYRKDDSSLVTTSIRLFPNANWSYEFSTRYDSMRSAWEERKVVVNHKFDCIGVGLGYKIDSYNDSLLWIQFWLTAFPQSVIDMGY